MDKDKKTETVNKPYDPDKACPGLDPGDPEAKSGTDQYSRVDREHEIRKKCIKLVLIHAFIFMVLNIIFYRMGSNFEAIFRGLSVDFPFFTKLSLAYVSFIRNKWYIFIVIVVGLLYGDYRIYKYLLIEKERFAKWWNIVIIAFLFCLYGAGIFSIINDLIKVRKSLSLPCTFDDVIKMIIKFIFM